MATSKLPAVAIAAMIERLKSIQPEVTELTTFLTDQGVDVPAVLAGAAPAEVPAKKGGMSKAQRKALSEKMKAKHAAAKAAKETTEAGGTPGDGGTVATPAETPAGIDLAPTPAATPAAVPA